MKKPGEKPVIDIYGQDRRIELARKRLLSDSSVCKKNKEIILEFIDYLITERKLSKPRIEKWINWLRPLARMLGKSFDKATKKDLKQLDKDILSSQYSDNTKADLESMLKRFYKWRKGNDEEYPPEVKWIRPQHPKAKKLRAEEVIQWEDVVKMSKFCQNTRDKAFIKVLFETGYRIGELLTCRIGSIEPLEYGCNLNLEQSKTQIRDGFIFFSYGDLQEYLNTHPFADDRNSPLWIRFDSKKKPIPMSYVYARKLLKVLGRKSGIKKRVNPHNFRHGSTTFWDQYLDRSEMNSKFGWSNSSRMIDTYLAYDSKRIRNKVLAIAGIVSEKKLSVFNEIKLGKCRWCGAENTEDRAICHNCKRLLNANKGYVVQRVKNKIDQNLYEFVEENPEIMNKYLEFMREKFIREEKLLEVVEDDPTIKKPEIKIKTT